MSSKSPTKPGARTKQIPRKGKKQQKQGDATEGAASKMTDLLSGLKIPSPKKQSNKKQNVGGFQSNYNRQGAKKSSALHPNFQGELDDFNATTTLFWKVHTNVNYVKEMNVIPQKWEKRTSSGLFSLAGGRVDRLVYAIGLVDPKLAKLLQQLPKGYNYANLFGKVRYAITPVVYCFSRFVEMTKQAVTDGVELTNRDFLEEAGSKFPIQGVSSLVLDYIDELISNQEFPNPYSRGDSESNAVLAKLGLDTEAMSDRIRLAFRTILDKTKTFFETFDMVLPDYRQVPISVAPEEEKEIDGAKFIELAIAKMDELQASIALLEEKKSVKDTMTAPISEQLGRKQTKDNDSDNSSESASTSEPESETSATASSTPNKTGVGKKRKSTAELSPPQSAKKAKAGSTTPTTVTSSPSEAAKSRAAAKKNT